MTMREIEINIRINEGWSNYGNKITVKADDKLHKVLSIINGGREHLATGEDYTYHMPENAIYYKQMGVMSKDSGFKWVDLETQKHGQTIGMFYGGIPDGAEFINLDKIREEGEYHYQDLIEVRSDSRWC
jgi:hypothetical protein